jgi:hypothetical protein
MTSLFCRHNRFTADCPICSKGTVLDPERQGTRPRSSGSGSSGSGGTRRASSRPAAPSKGARVVTGPYVTAGPYESAEDDVRYEVRLERVPGGVRMGTWSRGQLQRGAPVLDTADLSPLIDAARERALLSERDLAALEGALDVEASGPESQPPAEFGASPGRSGDLRDELRVEPLPGGRLRIARWIMRPNFGWELQDAPVMLPAKRYAEALRAASRAGLLAAG